MAKLPARARRAVFSICAPNYLARVGALMDSAARHLPDHARFVVLACERATPADRDSLPAGTHVLTPPEMAVPDLEVRRRLYNVTEFCTAIKPDVILWLWQQGFEEILYFDPDIVLFDRLAAVDAAWDGGAELVLTPHLVTTDPHPDWALRAVSVSGQFNLGFIGVRDRPEARRLVGWWRDRIAWNCIEDAGNGTFVDQKVVDHFPALSDAVRVIRHPGYNVAYWNIHERRLAVRDGRWSAGAERLVFFHYSGFEIFGAGISRHMPLPQPPGGAVDRLLRGYGRQLVARQDLAQTLRPYGYDRMPDGRALSPMLRKAIHRAIRAGEASPTDLLRHGWMLEPVAATPDLPYAGTIPRILQLLRRFADPPAEVRTAYCAYLEADAKGRRTALPPLLATLHDGGAIDVSTAEALIARRPVSPPADGRPTALAWPIANPVDDGTETLALPALPLLLHQARSDLSDTFDIAHRDDLVAYVAWFLTTGLGDWMVDRDTIDAIATGLDAAAMPAVPTTARTEAASLLDAALLHLFAPDRRLADTRHPAAAALTAIFEVARPERLRPALAQVLRAWLWHTGGGAPARILRLLAAEPSLREHLLGTAASRRVTIRSVESALARIGLPALARPTAPPEAVGHPAAPAPRTTREGPVIVGPFAATSGVGHSAHGVAQALKAAGLPPRTVDLLAPADAVERAAASLLVLHANADVALDAVVKFERLWRHARYRVGYWYWELAAMTRRMAAPSMLLDEIWVASEFVRSAVAPVVGCPVRVCPPVLRPNDFAPSTPEGGSFGADRRGYRFLGVLDARSFIDRKNPEGIVRAFRNAFPEGKEPVELLVKLSNGHHNPAGLDTFRRLAGGDRRIRVLEGSLSAIEMNDLYASADCFVSLHRSEGLGLGIAQAMMLGRPVIATGYSGPMDFMGASTACLVPYRLVPVRRDAYPDWLGQEWAEPDERAAAVYMKELAGNPGAGGAIGHRAAESVRSHFSAERIAPLMKLRAAPADRTA